MLPENTKKLRSLLVKHEGCTLFPYEDTTGNITIGFGRNLSARGVSQAEAFALLDSDITYFTNSAESKVPQIKDLDGVRQIALVDMCFNVGVDGFLNFKSFLSSIYSKNWDQASSLLMKSKAASQAPNRYKDLEYMIKTGKFNE